MATVKNKVQSKEIRKYKKKLNTQQNNQFVLRAKKKFVFQTYWYLKTMRCLNTMPVLKYLFKF